MSTLMGLYSLNTTITLIPMLLFFNATLPGVGFFCFGVSLMQAALTKFPRADAVTLVSYVIFCVEILASGGLPGIEKHLTPYPKLNSTSQYGSTQNCVSDITGASSRIHVSGSGQGGEWDKARSCPIPSHHFLRCTLIIFLSYSNQTGFAGLKAFYYL